MEDRSRNYTPATEGISKNDFISPLPPTKITSGFGERVHPVHKTKKFHNGVDLPININTPVKSVADGTILKVWDDTQYGGGLSIVVKHNNGTQAGYAHLNRQDVRVGQKINKGDIIGLSGNTGISTGPHLHFTFKDKNGKAIDPTPYFDFE